MIEVTEARLSDYMEFFSKGLRSYVLRSHGVSVAIGGVAVGPLDGEHWGYLEVRGRLSRAEQLCLVRTLKANLEDLNMPLKILCGSKKFPKAEKLVAALGFEPTDEIRKGERVWVWVT